MPDLHFSCACGTLSGAVRGASPKTGSRAVCYCDDCQAFAYFLGCERDILDENGGSDIFQTLPSRVEISKGSDRLACVRVTSKGVLRWYAGCCRTPIGNTTGTRAMPFVGLVLTPHYRVADGKALDDALGPPRLRVFKRYARGDLPPASGGGNALAMMAQLAVRMAGSRLRGDHRKTPFFNAETGAPVSAPVVLSAEERRDIDARMKSAA